MSDDIVEILRQARALEAAAPSTHVLACARYPAAKLRYVLPAKYFTQLEQNQELSSCCRQAENHDIEAFYSNGEERWRGKNPDVDMPNPPDIYVMYCLECGRLHRRFCIGATSGFLTGDQGRILYDEAGKPIPFEEERPFWDVR